MNENVKVNIDLGTKLAEGTKQAAQLRAHLEAAAKIRVAEGTATTSIANKMGGGETKTSRSIGMGAGTGSAASDFAAQAQGLGGLVHVYATFAANIYAVSAAFNALSKAADVSNLVKGLDQVGAASGRSLGTLAKQLVSVTDGALSMQDAMRSTALATSGGLTNSAIIRMTEVAKKASLALGRDIPDSMDRITKGIIKIQPELLDELGIMTRVIPAQQEYARSLGKTAAGLTDFEKRQAFANAVLEEGERKFSAIKLDANPYSKILASMQNISQTALEMINSSVGPLVRLLASSPTALATAMGVIATVLLKQAIPAIGFFKESMQKAADDSRNLALLRASEARKSHTQMLVDAKQAAENRAEMEIESVLNAEERIKAIKANIPKSRAAATRILNKDLPDITKEDVSELRLIAKKQKANSESALAHQEYANSLEAYMKSEEKYAEKVKSLTSESLENEKKYTTAKQNQVIANRALLVSSTQTIASQAAQNSATNGFVSAMKMARAEVAQARKEGNTVDLVNSFGDVEKVAVPAMGRIRGGWTLVKSSISAATGAISTFMNFLGPWMAIIGLVIGVATSLYSWLSKAEKESEAFSQSLVSLNEAGENVARTLEAISKKPLGEAFNAVSIQARATAFNTLSDSIAVSEQSFRNLLNIRSPIESFMDAIYDAVGKGDADKLASSLSSNIVQAFNLLENDPKAKQTAESAIKSLLGADVDLSSQKNLTSALRKLSDTEISSKARGVSDIFKAINQDINNTASTLTSFTDGLSAVGKLVTEFNGKLTPQDDQSKLGSALISRSLELTNVLNSGPINALAALNALAKDSQTLSLLPPDEVAKLIGASNELNNISKAMSDNANNLKLAKDTLAKLPKAETLAPSRSRSQQDAEDLKAAAVKSQIVVVDGIRKAGDLLVVKANEASKKLASAPTSMFVQGSKLMLAGLEQGLVASSVVAGQAYIEVLKQAGIYTSAEEGKLRQMEIDVQTTAIEAQYESIRTQALNSLAIDELRLTIERAALEEKIVAAKGGNGIGNLIKVLEATNAASASISKQREILTSKPSKVLKDFRSTIGDKGLDPTSISAFTAQKSVVEATIGREKALAMQSAKSYENSLKTQVGLLSDQVAIKTRNLDLSIKSKTAEKESLQLIEQYSGEYDEKVTKARQSLETSIAEDQYTKSRLEAEKKIDILKKVLKVPEPIEGKALTKNQKALVSAREELSDLNDKREKETHSLKIKQMDDTLSRIEVQRKKESNAYFTKIAQDSSIEAANLKMRESTLDYLNNIEAISKSEYTNKKAIIDTEIQQNSYLVERAELDKSYADQMAAKQKEISLAEAAKLGSSAALSLELDKIVGYYLQQVQLIDSANNGKKTSISLNAGFAAMLQAQNEQMDRLKSTTESLAVVFGEVGESIGKIGEALTKLADDEAVYKARIAAIDNAPDIDQKQKDAQKLSLENKYASTKLKNNAQIIGSVKKVFKEEQIGYKVLDGLEKTVHIGKILNDNKELVSTGILLAKKAAMELGFLSTSVAAEEAADMAKATSKIPSVIMSFMQFLGPYGTAAAAIAIAAVLGGGGSASSIIDTGPSAEAIQKTQGTGQAYGPDNKLYDTGGGVLGDSSAKSASLDNAINILSSTSVENLSYSNKMLDALLSIKSNISKAAAALFKTTGLNKKGGGIGIVEGETFAPNILNQGLKVITDNANFKIIDALTFGLNGAIAKELGNIFGGITTGSSIINQGVQLRGSFTDVANNPKNTINQFTDVLQTWEEKFLGKTINSQSHVDYNTSVLNDSVTLAVGEIFSGASNMFKQYGGKLGKSSSQIDSSLSGLNVSQRISLQGLSGQALTDEFTASINGILDDAARKVYPELLKFQQGGEGAFETVARVLDNSYKVSLAFDSIGKSVTQLSYGLAGYDISEALIESAHGLDNLLTITKQFGDDFLTEAERLAPIQKALTARMEELGFSSTDTKEEFKQLVLGFQITNDATADTYTSLLELAPAFSKVYDAVEKTRNVLGELELNNSKIDLQIRALTLLGRAEQSLALSRLKDLSSMDLRLVNAQKYIYALEDENSARTKLNTTIKATLTSIVSSIKTLSEYKNNLLVGDKSNITPAEKYSAAKAALEGVAAAAVLYGTTQAEKDAQSQALTKLPAASDAFLAASKELYASGAQYSTDFSAVLSILDLTSVGLEAQQSTAELQLIQLENTSSILGVIQENTKTTSQLMQEYVSLASTALFAQMYSNTTAQSTQDIGALATAGTMGVGIRGFANGGVASGISMVGEEGPEIVDFRSTARVYSNSASNDMFNNKELLAEIRALRAEVTQLRKEQKEQTGHIISTNYDANGQVAEAVNKTVDANNSNNAWLNRSIPKIA